MKEKLFYYAIGALALIGGLSVFCAIMGAMLRLLGVN